VFVNVQGDEPLLDPNAIDVAVNALLEEPQASISTGGDTHQKRPATSWTRNVVNRRYLDFDGKPFIFSRAPIPWVREYGEQDRCEASETSRALRFFSAKRCSIYPDAAARRVGTYRATRAMRWLENCWRSAVAEVEHDAVSVDVPEDVRACKSFLQKITTPVRGLRRACFFSSTKLALFAA